MKRLVMNDSRNNKKVSKLKLASLSAALLLLSACDSSNDAELENPAVTPAQLPVTTNTAPASQRGEITDLPRNAYFGDTHVHTGWSADAGMDGAITGPEEAYRFALGEPMTSNSGQAIQFGRPYDWFMITDHSDAMGTINEVIAENPEMMEDEVLRRWSDALKGTEADAADAKSELIVMQSEERLPASLMDPKWMVSAWEKTIEAAEKYNDPGQFTTFIAFEWTVNAGGGDNLHRNVIFRDGADRTSQILPLTTFQSQDPETLWAWLENYESSTGGQVFAIPHNGNMSNGRMFEEQRFDGSAMTSEWAESRQRFERLYEVTQFKGQSESHPYLSPDDEFADWDLWDRGNLILNPKSGPEAYRYEYWREALKSGMRLQNELGVNPFMFGSTGATDTHTGFSSTEEDNFLGKFKTLEPRAERWDFPLLSGPTDEYLGWEQSASGVTGVWAAENTREAIWDAMYRREIFSTTGPRMTVRFFGGYGFQEDDLTGDYVATGYSEGVPMGGMISGAENQPLSFIITATKDPEGANLDRVQVVKGWLDGNGETHEKIYDVDWSDERVPGSDGKLPAVGNTIDMNTGTYENSIGSVQFITLFTDPDFNADESAVYYVRVLEIPTPRWTLYDTLRFGIEMADNVPLVHQERAFSSPIWYMP